LIFGVDVDNHFLLKWLPSIIYETQAVMCHRKLNHGSKNKNVAVETPSLAHIDVIKESSVIDDDNVE
jgi:hypothetical protein